jgi:hypothetical protein
MASHGAAELTNWRTLGRTPGSASKVPIRIPTESAWLGLRANNDEPQSPQNHFSPVVVGLPDAQPVFALHDAECPWGGMGVRRGGGAAAALAAAAVAVARGHQRRRDLVADGAAVAAACQREAGHPGIILASYE